MVDVGQRWLSSDAPVAPWRRPDHDDRRSCRPVRHRPATCGSGPARGAPRLTDSPLWTDAGAPGGGLLGLPGSMVGGTSVPEPECSHLGLKPSGTRSRQRAGAYGLDHDGRATRKGSSQPVMPFGWCGTLQGSPSGCCRRVGRCRRPSAASRPSAAASVDERLRRSVPTRPASATRSCRCTPTLPGAVSRTYGDLWAHDLVFGSR